MKRIHIVGVSPRTGTTLLVECLRACFAIDAFDEHETSLWRHRRGVDIYLTKHPSDLWVVGPRLTVDPELHVIAMLRDPRDVIVSRHGIDPKRYWAPLLYWKGRVHLLERLRRHARFTVVRYEDLVRDPDGVQDILARRMPFLVQTARFSEFASRASPSAEALKALGAVRSINAERIGAWREHLPRVAGQLARHGPITEELIALGYEPDAGWLKLLEGIEPDLSRSHLRERERHPLRSRLRRLWRAYSEALTIGAARLLRIPIV